MKLEQKQETGGGRKSRWLNVLHRGQTGGCQVSQGTEAYATFNDATNGWKEKNTMGLTGDRGREKKGL